MYDFLMNQDSYIPMMHSFYPYSAHRAQKWSFTKPLFFKQELNITPKIAECKKILEMDSVRKGISIYSTLDFKEEVTGFEESLE